ncbi:MAG: asparagine synthase-related protein [Flavobacteriales bacterium]
MGGFHGHINLESLAHEVTHDPNPSGEPIVNKSGEDTIYTDGFIYNLPQLLTKQATTESKLLTSLYNTSPQNFPLSLKGEFTSVVCLDDRIEIATNHSCSRRVFYALQRGKLYFHYNLKKLQAALGADGFRSTPNPVALRSMLSIGGVFGNQTCVAGINLLRAGEKIIATKGNWHIHRYYLPDSNPTSLSKHDYLEELHSRFLTAVKEQYQHPGNSNFQLLSGGLDSRQNLSLAKQNGITQEAVLCFGQTDYRDHWISKEIADHYDIEHEFVSLENGDYLKNIDENTLAVDGLNFYASSAHFNYALDKSKTAQPIIHTGQIGRTIFTEHSFGIWQNVSEYSALLCSSRFADSINSELKTEMELYEDMDVFYLNNRLYRVISSGCFVAQKKGYIVSPFADPEVQNLAYTMPNKWKKSGKLQWEYLWKYHKEVMQFSQEEYGRPVRSFPEKFVGKVQNKLRNVYYKKVNKHPEKLSMNPLNHWYETNESLRNYWDNYYSENIERLEFDAELKVFCSVLFASDNLIEKTLALSVLSVMKNYFS